MARMTRPLCAAALAVAAATASAAQQPATQPFQIEEATIAGVHAAMRAGRLTCRALVTRYLERIDRYDKRGPALNAIVIVNPNAAAEADALDVRFKASGPVGPLHCVPAIVKDNFETAGLQTTAGSLALEGLVPAADAFMVKRIKAAGAIVMAKSNMAEFAFSPYETVNSILPGYTRNPYALDRVTAGSSGGTAAAVAASFGLIGLGTDTGNSIRGPASHQSLVGIRSTMGLTSRAGVAPLNLLADIAGPMTRTVADAVAVFQVIVGEDPDDPVTARSRAHTIPNYGASLVPSGLKGARIGILRQAYERPTTDPEIVAVFTKALDAMRAAGADIVEPDTPATAGAGRAGARGAGAGVGPAPPCMGFKYDINNWLARHADRSPMKTLEDVIRSRRFHPSIQARLESAQAASPVGPESESCRNEMAGRETFGAGVTKTMDDLRLDAYVYPTWSNPPRLIGDLMTPHGDNSQVYSPRSGFPAINVPMGYTRENTLPIGITFFGRAWDEARLIRLAYGFEQATRVRRPPASTPAIR